MGGEESDKRRPVYESRSLIIFHQRAECKSDVRQGPESHREKGEKTVAAPASLPPALVRYILYKASLI